MYESDRENGITHLLEHLSFRNANKIKNGEFYRLIDSLGLNFSACTYRDLVQFSVTGAAGALRKAGELTCLLLLPLILDRRETDLEIKRIKAEIREGDEKNSLEFFSDSFVWENTPLRNPITGTASGLDRFTLAQMEEQRKKIFSSENLFFYLTGKVSDADCLALCDLIDAAGITSCGSFRDGSAPLPAGFGRRGCRVELKNSPGCACRFSFDVDTSKITVPTLRLLYDVLFCGESCRLFMELSERSGLIYDYDARLCQYANCAVISFSFETDPRRLDDALEVCVRTLGELKRSAGEDLALALPAYTDNACLLLDSAEDLNWTRGYNGLILGEIYPDEAMRPEAYRRVTPEDLEVAASLILDPENLVFCLKADRKKTDLASIREKLMRI